MFESAWEVYCWFSVGLTSCVLLGLGFVAYKLSTSDCDLVLSSKAPAPLKSYEDKIVWITGASSGIGKALAREYARLGATLILSSRREKELRLVQSELGKGGKHKVLVLDLNELDTLADKGKEAIAMFGRVDVLVNNGGISTRSLGHEQTFEVEKRVMNVNHMSAVALTKTVLPGMIKSGSGTIINISSVAGKFPCALRTAYCASKFAMMGYFGSMGLELEKEGITCTQICPGPIDTPVSLNSLLADGSKFGKTMNAPGKLITAERCAELIVTAAHHKLAEAWISYNPALLGLYLSHYAPSLMHYLSRKQTPKVIASFRDMTAKKE